MTDNEKRAHDLAISMLPISYDMNMRTAEKEKASVVNFDAYNEYMSFYEQALKNFNQDFPAGK